MKTMIRLIALLLIGRLIGGCASSQKAYEGPSRPHRDVAVLSVGKNVRIRWVDRYDLVVSGKQSAELLPGEHSVWVYFAVQAGPPREVVDSVVQRSDGTIAHVFTHTVRPTYESITPLRLDFTAEPGRTYVLNGYWNGVMPHGEATVTISDASSKTIVGQGVTEY